MNHDQTGRGVKLYKITEISRVAALEDRGRRVRSCDPMSLSLILGRRGATSRPIGFLSHSPSEPGELITYSGDGHLLTIAPTGAGKSSGPVICNALTHPGQLIVLDMKGEIHKATAKARRKMGQKVHVIDLHDDGACGSLNPLDLAAKCGTESAAVARSFAGEFIQRTGNERDRFWNDWAESLLTGAISWLLDDAPAEERNLSSVFDLFNGEDPSYAIAVVLDTKKITSRAAKAAFAGFLNLSDRETRPSVLGTLQTHLRLFDSDLARRLTDTSSMNIDDLIAGKPMSLYFIVPAHRLAAYAPLLRMWISGLLLAMTQRRKPPKDRTLILCDEAGNLGRMDSLLTAATLMRSWGVTLWTFWQNAAQLYIYGSEATTLVDNAGVIQAFGVRNGRMAQDLANLIGGVSAADIMNLDKDEQMLLVDGNLRRCKQARYYNDELFAAK